MGNRTGYEPVAHIDMDAETVEIEDEDDIEAILTAPPDFTPEEAQSAIDNIRRSREEWK